jgi:hypothetical protein
VAGRIFDITRNYALAFEVCIAVMIIGAGVAYACRSYSAERTVMKPAGVPPPRVVAQPAP